MNLKDYLYHEWLEAASEEELLDIIEDRKNVYLMQFIPITNKKVRLKLISYYPYQFKDCINSLSYEDQLLLVKCSPNNIQYISNPTKEMQLAAFSIAHHFSQIKYIKNPDDEIKLLAVKCNPHSIQFIENPSEEMKILAVKQDHNVLRFIKEQSEELRLMAINQCYFAIEYMPNPSKDLQMKAIIKSNFDPYIIFRCPDWKELRDQILDAATIKDIIE